jgi:hypothetical protein
MNTQYSAWSLAIGKHFFGQARAQQSVFLTVDEETLWQISQQHGELLLFDERTEAVQDFAASVRREVYQHGWTVGDMQANCYPRFLGLLAMQVLAAFRMRRDDAGWETAYWMRLRELLNDTAASYMTFRLTEERHQELWRDGLERWANVVQEGRWGRVWLPPREPVGERRKHVSLPKSQALLSRADLEGLPSFYQEANFGPGDDVTLEDIRKQVERLSDKPSMFRSHARNVLRDERCVPACAQIREHLFHWEGNDSRGKGRLWLQVHLENPPELIGGITRGQPIKLEDVFGRDWYRDGTQGVFRPIRTDGYVTVLATSDEVWEERRYAQPGDDIMLLVKSGTVSGWEAHVLRVADKVRKYHAEQEIGDQHSTRLRGLPHGWRILRFRVREELPATLPRWIRRDPIQPVGGLRVDRNVWLAGAGPTLQVRASDVSTVFIDGQAYRVMDRHVTPQQAPCLNEPGKHIVWIWDQINRAVTAICEITIQESTVPSEFLIEHGWIQRGLTWPSPEWLQQGVPTEKAESHDTLVVRGPVVLDGLTKSRAPDLPVQRQWLELVKCLRGDKPAMGVPQLQTFEALSNPLLRQMMMVRRQKSYFLKT